MATRGLLRYCGLRSATRRLSYYHKGGTSCEPDEELHPNWSGLERRLQSRVPREKGHGVPEGRTNLKPSEEDFWHKAGVYDYSEASSARPSPEVATRGPACARLSTVKVSAENVPRVVALYKTSVAPVLQAMRSLEGLIEAPPDVVDTEVACSILPTTGGGDVSSGDSEEDAL
ncbi:hypothetical protein Esi_0013_0034 [Ectocarpus siliculosus]|uniref:Uncharacterized protein n=1 Tax=Ectocarpus siliculosus TaxID=2880 RepID=D8LE63_ECTSI|nr:hypothetical protein Esi_0013_0034 [Ectocarpus siliculosus]|eukprot:CBN74135.1 hypothetical protein Esi_0013_0034 [Ectocarpus siliculosus]